MEDFNKKRNETIRYSNMEAAIAFLEQAVWEAWNLWDSWNVADDEEKPDLFNASVYGVLYSIAEAAKHLDEVEETIDLEDMAEDCKNKMKMIIRECYEHETLGGTQQAAARPSAD